MYYITIDKKYKKYYNNHITYKLYFKSRRAKGKCKKMERAKPLTGQVHIDLDRISKLFEMRFDKVIDRTPTISYEKYAYTVVENQVKIIVMIPTYVYPDKQIECRVCDYITGEFIDNLVINVPNETIDPVPVNENCMKEKIEAEINRLIKKAKDCYDVCDGDKGIDKMSYAHGQLDGYLQGLNHAGVISDNDRRKYMQQFYDYHGADGSAIFV